MSAGALDSRSGRLASFSPAGGFNVLVWQASASSVAAASGSFRVDPALRGGVGVGVGSL